MQRLKYSLYLFTILCTVQSITSFHYMNLNNECRCILDPCWPAGQLGSLFMNQSEHVTVVINPHNTLIRIHSFIQNLSIVCVIILLLQNLLKTGLCFNIDIENTRVSQKSRHKQLVGLVLYYKI